MSEIESARQLLEQADVEGCIAQLEPVIQKEPNDMAALHLLGEALLEQGEPARAYEVLQKCAADDPTGKKGGIEKFLWLGQLSGGREGVAWYDKGLTGLREQLSAAPADEQLKRKAVKALCGVIEIWMTDLCMEPEAEQSCEALIAEAMMTEDGVPEAWSVLGSIRISQQRDDDARDALTKAWSLYQTAAEVGPEDIPSLVRLAQSSMEMGQYEQVIDVTAAVNQLDDQVPDPYYLNGLAHKMLSESTTDRERARHFVGAREAWTALLALDRDEMDPEMYDAVSNLINDVPEVDAADFSDSEVEDPDVVFSDDE